jgi:hypothetical protein
MPLTQLYARKVRIGVAWSGSRCVGRQFIKPTVGLGFGVAETAPNPRLE